MVWVKPSISASDETDGSGWRAGSRPGTDVAPPCGEGSRPASRPPAAPVGLVRSTYPA